MLCNRQGTTIAEKVGFFALKPITWAKPTLITVPTTTVAKAMICNLIKEPYSAVEVINNQTIHELGAQYDKSFAAVTNEGNPQ